jgi:hypothetical protein
MKGFVTAESFLLFYTAFIIATAYIMGLMGQSFLINVPSKPVADSGTFLGAASNIVLPFQYFIALLTTDVVPEFKEAFGIIIIPAAVVLIFIIAKHLPVIGSG